MGNSWMKHQPKDLLRLPALFLIPGCTGLIQAILCLLFPPSNPSLLASYFCFPHSFNHMLVYALGFVFQLNDFILITKTASHFIFSLSHYSVCPVQILLDCKYLALNSFGGGWRERHQQCLLQKRSSMRIWSDKRMHRLPMFQGRKKKLNASHPKSTRVGLTGIGQCLLFRNGDMHLCVLYGLQPTIITNKTKEEKAIPKHIS